MERVRLGGSELTVSRVGFGCCPMGGHGWGKVSPGELQRAVGVALDCGVTLFDTADVYGLGESERLLGKALRRRRSEAVIATKFGVRMDEQGRTFYDNSPEWIRRALEGSLRRLGVDSIDLYQVHYRDSTTALEQVFEALDKLRAEGKIRYFGLSNISGAEIDGIPLPEALLTFQSHFSLAYRALEPEIVKLRNKSRLQFISWGSLGQGVLSGKYRESARFPPEDRRSWPIYSTFHESFARNLSIVDGMRRMPSFPALSLPQIALRWIIDYMGGIPLVGIKNSAQIKEDAGALEKGLSSEEVAALEALSR